MPEAFLPICLPAMADSHDLDGLNLFVNFINDSVIADIILASHSLNQ